MKQIYPNLSLIGVNSTQLIIIWCSIKHLNDRDISIEKSRHIQKIIMLSMDNSWDSKWKSLKHHGHLEMVLLLAKN
jgi:hypothetical protein